MKDILAEVDRWRSAGEAIALATVVAARGSSPRRPGARLALTRSGKMVGSVSGGCVESDVFERAMQVLASGEPALATYEVAGEDPLEVGLSCGGSIDVLIQPFPTSEPWQAARAAVESESPAALAVGLRPAILLGRELAVLGDGRCAGSIERGLDRRVAREADSLLREGGARVVALARRGGEAEVFVEAFAAPLKLFVVGATHTAIALSRLAKVLGFRVTVVDARAAFASRERFPEADDVVLAQPDRALAAAGLDERSYVAILTHDEKFDVPALALALRSRARYVGVMGSRATYAQRRAELLRQGFTEVDLARIRAPIGLDLGGRAPEEIALSIVAEMQAVRYERDGRALGRKPAATVGGKRKPAGVAA